MDASWHAAIVYGTRERPRAHKNAPHRRPTLEQRSAVARRSAVPAGDEGRLLDPGRQLLLVDLVGLAHIEGAHVLVSADGRHGLERGPLEEAELHMLLEGCEGEEPTLPLHT